jgi:hypothetical protein
MNPEQQAQGVQPTSMTGSNWQRQALADARAAAAAAKHSDSASPAMEVARQRAAAQQVPDMLAAAEAAPPQPAQQPAQPQQAQPSQPAPQAMVATGEATGKPVVSGALAPDAPAAGTAVIGIGGPSTGKKIAMVLFLLLIALGAAAGGFLFFR